MISCILSFSDLCHSFCHSATYVCLVNDIQLLSYAMVICDDVDIGSVVVGDIHKKNTCAQLRLAEAIEVLVALRRTQLNLLYTGLGLEEASDGIVEDVATTRTF